MNGGVVTGHSMLVDGRYALQLSLQQYGTCGANLAIEVWWGRSESTRVEEP